MIGPPAAAGWPSDRPDRVPMRRAEVDIGALRSNAAAIVAHVGPGVEVMAMVKANGYGHDAVLASRAFLDGGARRLGVSSPEEAMQLRSAGIEAPILNVNWTRPERAAELAGAGVEMMVVDLLGVAAVAAGARDAGVRARVHVKQDTGMGRLGARAEAVAAVLEAVLAEPSLELAGFCTHFADADGIDPAFTEEQHRRFVEHAAWVRDRAPGALLHCANSAATLRMPHTHHDVVRPGIALYGYPPGGGRALPLRPALTFIAPVTQVKTVRRGDTVGYGRTWRAERDTRVATVASGYADGVHRVQSNRGAVLIGGMRCPMVGRVSMDQLSADVSGVAGVQPGDEAVLVGRQGPAWLGADEVGMVEGTISYEVVCAISARVPRRPV